MEQRNCDYEQCREVDLTVGILTDREWLLTKMFCFAMIHAGVLGPKAYEITRNAVGAFAHMPDRAELSSGRRQTSCVIIAAPI